MLLLPPGARVKFLGCEILHREACRLASESPFVVDLQFMPKGLHDLSTAKMLETLQAAVDAAAAEGRYAALLLGYARCNDGVVGLRAPAGLPLVIPRAHDCITLFFGSRAAYGSYFDARPGTYFRTTGWTERDDPKVNGQAGIMEQLGLAMSFEQMVEKYGRENAEFIRETLGDWRRNYKNLCYLEMGVCDESAHVEQARREAAENHWSFDGRRGDLALLSALFNGPWQDDFVVVAPGRQIISCNDPRVLDAT